MSKIRVTKTNRRVRQGSIMVQALIVLAGLVTLMAVLAANQHTALQATQDRMRVRRADMAAHAAVSRALAIISSANTNLVTLNDEWAQLGDHGNMTFDMGDSTSTFRMEIVDASSLVNVNTITQAQLLLLPLTQEQQDSLLDWRTTGTTARASGAKDDYYNALTVPYNTKMGRLNSINDLLLVRGWTANTLLNTQPTQSGDVATSVTLQDANGNTLPLISILTADSGEPNQQASGTARVNLSGRLTANSFQRLGIQGTEATNLAAGGPYTSFATLLARPGVTPAMAQQLLNGASFSSATRLEGKINLNTTTQAVLETVTNVTPDIANSIVEQQTTGFTTLGSLASVAGLTGARLGQVADSFGVGSDTWIVRAYGESGGVGVAMEAVIGIRNKVPQIVTWNRLRNAAPPPWWNWTTEPTETADAGDSVTTATSTTTPTSGGTN